MAELIIVISGLLCISFLCSLLESVILSLSRPYVQLLVDRRKKSGKILQVMKDKIDEPIAAILTLNTISHTMGAAISGALAIELFGSRWMGLFSALLTLLILIFSEIIPKTIGARYWKSLSPVTAYFLRVMIFILKPIIIPINFISGFLTKGDPGAFVSKAEIYNFLRIGYHQGVLDVSEFEIIENLLKLGRIKVKNIMTPRTVVYWLNPDQKVREIADMASELNFSRIPLYDGSLNRISGIVLRRDIMNAIADKKIGIPLEKLSIKPMFVIETISVLKLLNLLVKDSIHMAIVLNEFGDYIGIVTMEDAIETLLGAEIVDEFDAVVDMRELALEKGSAKKDKFSRKSREK